MRNTTRAGGLALGAVLLLSSTVLAACGGSHSGQATTAPISFTAGPAASADLAQAKADVQRCIAGTPLQQVHTVHVLLLEKASGGNGAEVTATRAKVFGCLGVPESQRTQFKNDALTAAEHGKVYTKPGVKAYLEVNLPALLNKYQQQGDASTPATSASQVPATFTPVASPSAKASPAASAS